MWASAAAVAVAAGLRPSAAAVLLQCYSTAVLLRCSSILWYYLTSSPLVDFYKNFNPVISSIEALVSRMEQFFVSQELGFKYLDLVSWLKNV